MCFIGYSKNPKRYRLIDLSTDKVVTKRVVVFNETDFRFSNEQMMKVGQFHLKMRHLKVNLNQKSHHKDHNEQFDVQTTMDILNMLTQQCKLSIVLTVCKRYLSQEHLMKHSAVHMQKSGNVQLTWSINLMTLGEAQWRRQSCTIQE